MDTARQYGMVLIGLGVALFAAAALLAFLPDEPMPLVLSTGATAGALVVFSGSVLISMPRTPSVRRSRVVLWLEFVAAVVIAVLAVVVAVGLETSLAVVTLPGLACVFTAAGAVIGSQAASGVRSNRR